jgi:hypothetical protein
MTRKSIFYSLLLRVAEAPRFIQVLAGPRQVGGQGIPIEEFLSQPAAHWLE